MGVCVENSLGCNTYGQLCDMAADCCHDVPCNEGRCKFIPM